MTKLQLRRLMSGFGKLFDSNSRKAQSAKQRFRQRRQVELLEDRTMLSGSQVVLGPSDNLALDQPRTVVLLTEDEAGTREVGPFFFRDPWLLDTGANSILAGASAVAEMVEPPYVYQTEGTFAEKGVGGTQILDISAPYYFHFTTEGEGFVPLTMPNTRILSDANVDFSILGPWGILGMPAMTGRVTTLDYSGWSGGALPDLSNLFMKTTFDDTTLPAPETGRTRVSISVDNRISFDPIPQILTGNNPPIWADIPFMTGVPTHGGVSIPGNFLFDTGAQVSIISKQIGLGLGLDSNGDGALNDQDTNWVRDEVVGGVGGQTSAPVFHIDEMRVPTDQGVDLVWTNLQWLVIDIDTGPGQDTLDGVFGSDLLTSGWAEAVISGGADGYIWQAHLDFRNWSSGAGKIYFDLTNSVNITPATLVVNSLTPTASGFTASFDQSVDASLLNLYNDVEAGALGAPDLDVTVNGNRVPGTVVFDSSMQNMTFLATGGVLPDGDYTVTLKSGVNGFKSDSGALLDGNQDGTPGDDLITTFTVNSSARSVGIPDFARGAGQVVDVPATSSGIPLTISDGANAANVSLELLYDPALLNISGINLGNSAPAGASVLLNTSTPGVAQITFSSPTPLNTGAFTFANLTANVPANAPYGSKQILDISNLQVRDAGNNLISSRADDGVHLVAYLGDVTGSQQITGLDASRTAQLAAGISATNALGFAAFQLADPALIADVTGDGNVMQNDANAIAQEFVDPDGNTLIPNLPSLSVPPPAGGPDPRLFINNASGAAGQTVTATVGLQVTEAGGITTEAIDVVIGFDPALFDVNEANIRIKSGGTGDLLQKNYTLARKVDNATGRIVLTLFTDTPESLANNSIGDILEIDFQIDVNAAAGQSLLDLRKDNSAAGTQETAMNEALAALNPAPTNASPTPSDPLNGKDDNVDGVFSIGTSNTAPVADDDSYAVDEDQTLTVNAATGVLLGDTDADGDNLTAEVVTGPGKGALTLNSDGSFTYVPNANVNGSDSFTYKAKDGKGGEDTATVTITINAFNDAPVADDDSYAVHEDETLIVNIALGVLNGDLDVDGDTLMAEVASLPANGTLVLNADGSFVYAPAANFNGTDSFTYKAKDGNGGEDLATVTITVNSVNDAPTFTLAGDQTVNEDAGAQTVANFLTNASAGPADETGQTLTLTVTNDNNGLFAVQPAINLSTGQLTYTAAADANGAATVSVTLKDNGGTANNGNDTSTQTFAITVNGVNDAPTFTLAGDQTVNEDAGPQAVPNFLTNAAAGPANESGQTFTLTVSNNNNALFAVQPIINLSTGQLNYTPIIQANGAATVTVTLKDNGGTANNGVDTSIQTFSITINGVNDAPTFTLAGDQTVNQDAGAQAVANFLTNAAAGPANESGQTLSLAMSNDNNALFATQPAINLTTGQLTYTPATQTSGAATVTVTLSDNGGTANGGVDSSSQAFTITVKGPNQPPVLQPIDDVTLPVSQDNVVINVSASDPDQDALTYSASAGNLGHVLDQIYELEFDGSFFQNFGGAQERWLRNEADDTWFFIKPNGEFYRWDNTPNQATGELLANLNPIFYHRPELIFNSQPNDLVFVADQALGLTNTGNLSENWGGANERWLQGNNFSATNSNWYFIKPNGELYAWNNLPSATGVLLATLDPIYYEQIDRLSDPQPATMQAIFNGSQLTLDPTDGFVGTFYAGVSACDSQTCDNEIFRIDLIHRAPVLAPIGDQIIHANEDSLTVDLNISNPEGGTLSISADAGSMAYLLDQKHSLQFGGSFFENYGGAGERWLRGSGSLWYFILPNGQFYQWDETPSQASGTLLATLEPVYFQRPRMLYDAQPGPLAFALDQALGLQHTGNLFENYGGAGERWLLGSGNQWYFIKPDGTLYAWDGTARSATGTLVATLNPIYFSEIDRLHNAQPNQFDVALSNNQLTISVADGFVGTFFVEVEASNGFRRTSQLFQVTRVSTPKSS